MMYTEEEKIYLANKHRGGKNNSKGNAYENYYAVFCIAQLINNNPGELKNISLSSQLEYQFIDDLLIVKPQNNKVYHQIKDVKNLTWDKSNLESDFAKQKKYSTLRKENFKLKLVCSSLNDKIQEIPKDFSDCTSVVSFPTAQSINQLVLTYKPFKKAISEISTVENPTDDIVACIATALLGIWSGSEQKDISLQYITEKINTLHQVNFSINVPENAKISEKCQKIFDSFNINYKIKGDILEWSNKKNTLKGLIKWTKEKEYEIENADFPDKWSFLSLLNNEI